MLLPYLLATGVALSHHEPWRDEAYGWLAVRDSSLAGLFALVSDAGTPILWYLLLWPLVKAGLPYWTMGLLHLLVATAAVLVFLWRAPLPRLTKVLFIFSYYIVFEYAIVARTYALGILILFLIAAIYPDRLARATTYALLLAVLFQTNVHSFLIGLVLGASYLEEVWRRGVTRRWAVTAVIVFGALLTVAQVFPRSGGQFPLQDQFQPQALLWAAQGMFFPMVRFPMLWILSFLVWAAIVCGLWPKRRLLLLLAAVYFLLLSLFIFQWSLADAYRHFGLLLIVVIFILWIEPSEPLAPSRARPWVEQARNVMHQSLNLGLASLCLVGAFAVHQEIRYDFSGSRRMAQYLLSSGLAAKTIVAHRASAASALLPYLPGKRFWYAGIGEYGTYMRWDRRSVEGDKIPYEVAVERMKQAFGNRSDVLLLLNVPLPQARGSCLRLRYWTETPIFAKRDERFYLYQRDPSCQEESRTVMISNRSDRRVEKANGR